MINQQATKLAAAIVPATVNNASATAVVVDTLGYSYAELVLFFGATDIALTALKVQECDTSGGSYTDVTGTVVGTDNTIAGVASVLPSATDDNHFFVFDLNLPGKRKRYLKLIVTVGNGSVGAALAAWATLSRGQITPVTAADRGVTAVLRV